MVLGSEPDSGPDRSASKTLAGERNRGGVIHTYQQYDPQNIPSPSQPPPDLVSPVFEHMLEWGDLREFSEEQLANAIRLDPGQFAGLGPSLDSLIKMLEERRKKLLSTYETRSVAKKADKAFRNSASRLKPPGKLEKSYREAVRDEQIYALESLWYRAERIDPQFASQLPGLIDALGTKYQIDQLSSTWEFTGTKGLSIPEALDLLAELQKIEELLKQLREAKKNARLAIIDMDELSEFADPEMVSRLSQFQEQIQNYLRDLMEGQGLSRDSSGVQLSPRAYKIFQGRLLERIFSNLKASRSGRHQGPIEGEGSVEMQRTRPYEFGDPVALMDIPSTFINAMLRQPNTRNLSLKNSDIEIHRTRNNPKCATTVLMDMSGSMRYGGQYVNVKRMALALNGLITSEFPGDYLKFIEIHTFAKQVLPGELIRLMPKMPTITNPVVRLRADMSREDISEIHIPPHFTNIQHALQMSRQLLSVQDTPNRQVILITDGLPTAHFEGSNLYMLYPPDPQTEEATMREGNLCARDGITINIFLLPSWSQTEEDVQFAHRLAKNTGGRVFFTAGKDLDRYVIWDYVNHRREIIS